MEYKTCATICYKQSALLKNLHGNNGVWSVITFIESSLIYSHYKQTALSQLPSKLASNMLAFVSTTAKLVDPPQTLLPTARQMINSLNFCHRLLNSCFSSSGYRIFPKVNKSLGRITNSACRLTWFL